MRSVVVVLALSSLLACGAEIDPTPPKLPLWPGGEPGERARGPERPHARLHEFRVADLPRVSAPPRLDPRDAMDRRAPRATRIDDLAPSLLAIDERATPWRGLTRDPKGAFVGRFDGWDPPLAFARDEETFVACRRDETGPSSPLPARFLSLAGAPAHRAILTIVDAWITGARCAGWVERVTRIPVASIHPSDVMMAFVDTRAGLPPDLVVLLPESSPEARATEGLARVATGGLAEARFPLRPASGAELVARVELRALDPWFRGLEQHRATRERAIADDYGYTLLGLELVPGEGEEPLATTWTALVRTGPRPRNDDLFDPPIFDLEEDFELVVPEPPRRDAEKPQ